jgi:hypothetical protein
MPSPPEEPPLEPPEEPPLEPPEEPLEPPLEPPEEPLEPPLEPLEPLEPPLGGGIPPPLGAGMPAPGIPPPDAPPLVLHAPVTTAAKAMKISGLIQLGSIDSERRVVMFLTLSNARTPKVLELKKRG